MFVLVLSLLSYLWRIHMPPALFLLLSFVRSFAFQYFSSHKCSDCKINITPCADDEYAPGYSRGPAGIHRLCYSEGGLC